MKGGAALGARVKSAVQLHDAERDSLGHALDAPTLREGQRRAARLEYLAASKSAIVSGLRLVLKRQGGEEVWREERAFTVELVATWRPLSQTARTEAEREAYRAGADWLEGGAAYELPGAVVMARAARPDRRVLPLPFIESELARAEADLAAAVAQLESALSAWEQQAEPVK